MRVLLPIAFALLPAAPAAAGDEDFQPLFNGKDFDGWVNVNCAPGTWTVRDGMVISTGKPTGVLRTVRQYENFVLELEWRHMVPGGNAGVFVWSDPITARGQPFTRAIECQVLDGRNSENYTSHGDVFAIHGAVLVPDRPHPAGWARSLPSEHRAHPSPEWNHYRITCIDGVLKLAVNGKEVSGGHDIRPRRGYICLESEGSEAHFRNIRIHELPPSKTPLGPDDVAPIAEEFTSLYTGVDLSGWKLAEGGEAHWQANDWRLQFDGKGPPLESAGEYGDIVLIADWRLTGKPARSKDEAADERRGESAIRLRGRTGCRVSISSQPGGSGAVDAARPPRLRADAEAGQWNRFVIRLEGNRVEVELNGEKVTEGATLPGLPERGPIILGVERGGAIEFANLYVKEL